MGNLAELSKRYRAQLPAEAEDIEMDATFYLNSVLYAGDRRYQTVRQYIRLSLDPNPRMIAVSEEEAVQALQEITGWPETETRRLLADIVYEARQNCRTQSRTFAWEPLRRLF